MTLKQDIAHLSSEVKAIRTWQRTHDKAHVTDDERLNIILDTVTTHQDNHHGMVSTMKKDGLLVMAVSLLYGLVELVRTLGLPFLS